jgi:hypothetical protein
MPSPLPSPKGRGDETNALTRTPPKGTRCAFTSRVPSAVCGTFLLLAVDLPLDAANICLYFCYMTGR